VHTVWCDAQAQLVRQLAATSFASLGKGSNGSASPPMAM
jgi:hypothetical protein